jgi:hypothetical protein
MATALAAGTSGLLEREGILAELHQAHDKALAGNGRLVLVAGEAGGGKTALLGRFCDDLAGHTTALRGGCDPLLTPRPLGPFLDLGEAASGRLADAVREGASAHDVAAAALAAGESGAPLVLVLEDRRAVQLGEDGPGGVAGVRSRERVGEPAPGLGGDVGEGAEGARRGEVLARPCEDPCIRARAERADEAGLADTRLPADEHQAPALAPGVFQEREQLLPLEQLRHVRLHGAPTLTRRVRPHDPGEARGASRLAP